MPVSNSSPLIALADIEQLDLLPTLFELIVIPPAVAAEIARTVPTGLPCLRVEGLTGALPKTVQRPSLGAGEREAIVSRLKLLQLADES